MDKRNEILNEILNNLDWSTHITNRAEMNRDNFLHEFRRIANLRYVDGDPDKAARCQELTPGDISILPGGKDDD